MNEDSPSSAFVHVILSKGKDLPAEARRSLKRASAVGASSE